jgi:hypothetical protein
MLELADRAATRANTASCRLSTIASLGSELGAEDSPALMLLGERSTVLGRVGVVLTMENSAW